MQVKEHISPVNIKKRQDLNIRSGDTVRVWQKIKESSGKIRLQAFEGVVLARKHGNEAGATFTVRKIASGVGVEKIFPLYSPMIDKIEIVRRSKVRRSKLYYIREKVAREIKRQMRRMQIVNLSSGSDMEEKEAQEQKEKEEQEEKERKEKEAKEVQEAQEVEENQESSDEGENDSDNKEGGEEKSLEKTDSSEEGGAGENQGSQGDQNVEEDTSDEEQKDK